MLSTLEIYINGQLTDVDKDTVDLSVNYAIADISNLDSRKSAISKTLTFAGTKNNLKVFGFPDEPNVIDEVDQNEIVECKIVYNGETLLQGVF